MIYKYFDKLLILCIFLLILKILTKFISNKIHEISIISKVFANLIYKKELLFSIQN